MLIFQQTRKPSTSTFYLKMMIVMKRVKMGEESNSKL